MPFVANVRLGDDIHVDCFRVADDLENWYTMRFGPWIWTGPNKPWVQLVTCPSAAAHWRCQQGEQFA